MKSNDGFENKLRNKKIFSTRKKVGRYSHTFILEVSKGCGWLMALKMFLDLPKGFRLTTTFNLFTKHLFIRIYFYKYFT